MKHILLFLLVSTSLFAQTSRLPLKTSGAVAGKRLPLKSIGATVVGKRIGVAVEIKGKIILATAARTSARVKTKAGQHVRSLWQNVTYAAGEVKIGWDGTGDFGETVAAGDYLIDFVSNNVTYEWQGVVGNTSYTGPNSYSLGLHGNYQYTRDLVITGITGIRGDGYGEGPSAINSFSVTSPQVETEVNARGTDMSSIHLATDGVRVYSAGYDLDEYPSDGLRSKNSGVRAVNLSNNSPYTFSSGTTYTCIHGPVLSLTSFKSDTSFRSTGLAVQPSGNYLFVAYAAKNMIRVMHKLTGALISEQTVNAPARMQCDGSGNLWVISGTAVQKRIVASDGTIGNASLTLPSTVLPLALGLSTDYATVAVCDGGTSQQVKAYSTADGSSQWTKGTAGGYWSDPLVSTDKFYFNDPANSIRGSYIAFQSDGSFWVGDEGNYRTLHYNADRTYKEQIAWLPNNYSPYVDQNDATRVFAQYLEYKIDYTKPNLLTAGAWVLWKNWRAMVPVTHFDLSNQRQNIFLTGALKNVTTVPANGRTYALTYRPDGKSVVVELPASGPIRTSTIALTGQVQMLADGSLMRSVKSGMSILWRKQTIASFDANGWPVWNAASTYASIPSLTTNDPLDWTGFGNDIAIDGQGNLISFDKNLVIGGGGNGYHLGSIPAGGTSWSWLNALATHLAYQGNYPTDGAYDLGNSVTYAGGDMINATGNNIFWNYRGEFWKQPPQCNYWQHVDAKTGLLLGLFGNSTYEATLTNNFAGMAGNVFYGQAVTAPDGNIYIYHGEEAGWHGVHRWKVGNLSSIQTQTINATVSAEIDPRGVAIFTSLPRNTTLADGQNGIRRSPAIDDGEYTVRTGAYSYDKHRAPDLYVQNNNTAGVKSVTATIPGSYTNLSAWTIQFVLDASKYYINRGDFGETGSGGVYTEILDRAGKILIRYSQKVDGDNVRLLVNGQLIKTGKYFGGTTLVPSVPVKITATGTSASFSYGTYTPVTVNAFETGGDMRSPGYIRIFHWIDASGGQNSGRIVDIADAYIKPVP